MKRYLVTGAMMVAGLIGLALFHVPRLFGAHIAASVSPTSANSLSRAALAAQKPKLAEQFARESLRNDPLFVANLGQLALAREAQGARASAARIMSLAAAYSWRDMPIQRWLFIAAVSTDSLGEMILHADAIERKSQGQDFFLSALFLGALNGQTADFVADRLAADPPYREAFFTLARNLASDKFASYDRFRQLMAKRGSPLSRSETRPYVDRLIAAGKVGAAERAWSAFRNQGERSPTLRDPDFVEFGKSTTGSDPFGWVRPEGEVPMEFFVGARDGMDEQQALNVRGEALGPIELISQIVHLPAGPYVLSFNRQIEEGDADAFRWRLVCLASGRTVDPTKVQTAVSGAWERERDVFQTSGCSDYRLALMLDNPLADPQSIWIRHLELLPISSKLTS